MGNGVHEHLCVYTWAHSKTLYVMVPLQDHLERNIDREAAELLSTCTTLSSSICVGAGEGTATGNSTFGETGNRTTPGSPHISLLGPSGSMSSATMPRARKSNSRQIGSVQGISTKEPAQARPGGGRDRVHLPSQYMRTCATRAPDPMVPKSYKHNLRI